VQHELVVNRAQLERAKARLARLRARLKSAMKVLKQRLVATYESDEPDVLTVILNSHGFNQLSSRYQYLSSIEHQDASIVATVRRLKNEMRNTVNTIRAARDRLSAERDALVSTRTQLQGRESALAAVRSRKQQ